MPRRTKHLIKIGKLMGTFYIINKDPDYNGISGQQSAEISDHIKR